MRENGAGMRGLSRKNRQPRGISLANTGRSRAVYSEAHVSRGTPRIETADTAEIRQNHRESCHVTDAGSPLFGSSKARERGTGFSLLRGRKSGDADGLISFNLLHQESEEAIPGRVSETRLLLVEYLASRSALGRSRRRSGATRGGSWPTRPVAGVGDVRERRAGDRDDGGACGAGTTSTRGAATYCATGRRSQSTRFLVFAEVEDTPAGHQPERVRIRSARHRARCVDALGCAWPGPARGEWRVIALRRRECGRAASCRATQLDLRTAAA